MIRLLMSFGGGAHGSGVDRGRSSGGPLRLGLNDEALELSPDPAEDPLLLRNKRSDDGALLIEVSAHLG